MNVTNEPNTPLSIPRVGPLGLVHVPASYRVSARQFPTGLRLAALLVLSAFLVSTVGTTAYSLGAYCLTTWAGHPGF